MSGLEIVGKLQIALMKPHLKSFFAIILAISFASETGLAQHTLSFQPQPGVQVLPILAETPPTTSICAACDGCMEMTATAMAFRLRFARTQTLEAAEHRTMGFTDIL